MNPRHNPVLFLPGHCASPVDFLLPMVGQALANIAPERLDDLKREIEDVQIEILDEPVWRFCYVPETNGIVLTTTAVEVCWAASYAYLTLHDSILANRSPDMPREVDLTADPQIHRSMRLLTWAFRKFADNSREPWPDDLPCPTRIPSHASTEHAASELALCALGFLMHHEVAHHRLRHSAVAGDEHLSLEQEREADSAAADWILTSVPSSSQHHKKRLFGVVVGLALTVAHDMRSGDYDGRLHPRSFDRLLFTLDRFIRDDVNHDAWALAVGILCLHLCSEGIAPPEPSDDSFRGGVDAVVEMLASASS
jgi:Peptidase U49